MGNTAGQAPLKPERLWEGLLGAGILLVAAGLRLWRLDQNGYSNLHYAATIRSMTMNWHNFFFASFDPAGLLSVDKPPVAFWIQGATAKLIGFRGLSVTLPQALEGVAAVLLIYHLVRRCAGSAAALLAGLVLAVTPVSVAVDRSNSPDSCLVLVLLLAAWALSLGIERGRPGLLLLAAALVGLAFNVKMLVAYGVLPVFGLASLLGSTGPPRTRLIHLAAAGAVLVGVSASWGLAVDLTPPEHRPYVGSSPDNSVLGLTLGYNGLDRLLGLSASPSASPAARFTPGPGRPGMPGFGGPPGPLRLAGTELAGQITWLIPLAVLGALAVATETELRRPLRSRGLALLLWGGWLFTYATIFSLSRGIIHPYYLVLLAPPVAALTGMGTMALFGASRRGGRGTAALATALVATAAWQARILDAYPGWRARLLPFLAAGTSLCVAGLIASHVLRSRPSPSLSLARASLGIGLLSLLLGPVAWALTPVIAEGNPIIPVADPALLDGSRGLAPPFLDPAEIRPLVSFLREHRRGERFLLATPHLMLAAMIIVETGEPIIAAGGFMGTTPVLNPARFAELVATRQLRYALLTGSPSGNPLSPLAAPGGGSVPPGWRLVRPALWQPVAPASGRLSDLGLVLKGMDLYDCAPESNGSDPTLDRRRSGDSLAGGVGPRAG
jgi:4-amino-4-deoxy-L-arabinose transferase-like glycosyltransferase